MPTISNSYTGSVQDLDDYCAGLNYQANILVNGVSTPNPESKTDFFKRKQKEYAKNVVISYRANKDGDVARNTTITNNANFTF